LTGSLLPPVRPIAERKAVFCSQRGDILPSEPFKYDAISDLFECLKTAKAGTAQSLKLDDFCLPGACAAQNGEERLTSIINSERFQNQRALQPAETSRRDRDRPGITSFPLHRKKGGLSCHGLISDRFLMPVDFLRQKLSP
jgi:hypothetical protein